MGKNANSDKYSYSDDGTGFDSHGTFSLSDGSRLGNSMFGVVNSSSTHIHNRKVLIPGKSSMQGLDDTTLTAEAEYSIDICEQRKIFLCISTLYKKHDIK